MVGGVSFQNRKTVILYKGVIKIYSHSHYFKGVKVENPLLKVAEDFSF